MASATRPPMGEIKAYENSRERNDLNMLADLYSIIKATDLLEAAYSRDAISAVEYNEECSKLIAQFKATEKSLILNKTIESATEFYREYQVDCPRAFHRLIEAGMIFKNSMIDFVVCIIHPIRLWYRCPGYGHAPSG